LLILIIAAALLIIFIETPALVRQRRWKELAVFSGFLISGLILGVILALHLAFPNLTQLTEAVFRPVQRLLVQ